MGPAIARVVGLLAAYFGISLLERVAYAAAEEAALQRATTQQLLEALAQAEARAAGGEADGGD